MPILHRDFETRSRIDLRAVGAYRYTADASTEVLCCAYCVDDSEILLWLPGDPVPAEWIAAAADPSFRVAAFNDAFERLVERHIMGPRHGWPLVPIERHVCLQASASSRSLPQNLENAALALKLSQQKDMAGRKNMLALSRPDKEGNFIEDPARLAKLYDYCKADVAAERGIHERIGLISAEEQKVWILDAAVNDRGVYIDEALARGAVRVNETARTAIDAELNMLTGGAVTTVDEEKRLKEWLNANGCEIPNLQKGTVARALERKDLSPAPHRVLELRRDGAGSATDKFATMVRWRAEDGRARGALNYHGASTGRWSSLGLQLHNMKRIPKGGADPAVITAVKSGDIEEVRKIAGDNPLAAVGSISRAALIPAPGFRFIDADFSGIKSRVLAFLAGETAKIALWARFDATQDPLHEPYYVNGLAFGIGADKARDAGKTGDLAFGFAGGVGSYRKFGDPNTPEAEANKFKMLWRQEHPNVCRFWGLIESQAIKAMQNLGVVCPVGEHISWRYDGGDFLVMRLPSGRELSYPFPQLFVDDDDYLRLTHMDNAMGKWVEVTHFGKRGTWKGKLTENAVQAVARDIFAAAMPRLEAAGYPVVLHLHDEILCEVPENFGSVEEFIAIQTIRPDWATGMPIAAKGDVRERFCKMKSAGARTIPAELTPKTSGSTQIASEDEITPERKIETPGFDAIWDHKFEAREAHDPAPEIETEADTTIEPDEDACEDTPEPDNTSIRADITGKCTYDHQEFKQFGRPIDLAEWPEKERLQWFADQTTAILAESNHLVCHDESLPVFMNREEILPEKPRIKLLNYAEMLDMVAGEWLVQDVVPSRAKSVLFGTSNSFKSFHAVDLGCSVATGRTYHGKVTKQCKVVYVANEGAAGVGRKRIPAWMAAYKIPADLRNNIFLVTAETILPDEESRNNLLAGIRAVVGPDEDFFLIIDVMRGTMNGSENDDEAAHAWTSAAECLIAEGASLLTVTHSPYAADGRMRGHSHLWGSFDTRLHAEGDKDKLTSVLRVERHKDHDSSGKWEFALDPIGIEEHEGETSLVPRLNGLDHAAAARPVNDDVDNKFLELVERFNSQGRNAAEKSGRSYAPAAFAKETANGGYTSEQFEKAMSRLLLLKKIELINHGSPRRPERTFVVCKAAP